jgi:hypothetical protein
MILSNQIRCKLCGDTPWSGHVHDMRYCKCGEVAADGGMDYLRRVGNMDNWEDMSIWMENDICGDLRMAISEAMKRKNALGILCLVARALRDAGYEIKKK